MKTIFASIAAGALLASLSAAQPAPHYNVVDLGLMGGPGTNTTAFGVNNAGWVSGSGNLVPGGPQHAFLWFAGGPLKDLGTVDGAACPTCSSGADAPNALGEAPVGSDSAAFDPDGEDFCVFGSHRVCRAAVWRNGKLVALPNLPGGKNANAFGINNRGQVIGFAENGVPDSSCAAATPFQVQRFDSVIWDPAVAAPRKLSPLTAMGDTVSFAFSINESGQAVGSSGTCDTQGLPPGNVTGRHAVLWERNGAPTYLGTLGDANNTMFNVATSINAAGEVVGTSQSTDGSIHSFFWNRQTGMRDIGTLPGAFATIAGCCGTLNNKRQITGFSIDGTTFNSTAFLWQNGTMYDLNTLIPSGSGWTLFYAAGINDAGEIAGQGIINGELHAFIAVPK